MDANDLNFANQISFDNRGEYLDGEIPKVALKKVNERIVFQQVGGIDSRGGGALVFHWPVPIHFCFPARSQSFR